ncbi:MliC family protein [Pectobacterium cacticida]|uniref:MliC family protein n=1 Tax=Pectobacterium cacticida TaxID=69221 RepID=A0ABZ2G7N7_9GAMM|nr:MliC family protein [Pectobacterium cacticida]UYX08383.1 MliC family protein [Pectobacterium cacticida]
MKPLLIATTLILLSGCSYFDRKQTVETLHYQCGTMPLTVTLQQGGEAPAQVSFLLDGEYLKLLQTVSASGARYSNGTYTFWSKGDSAFIQRGERVIVDDCVLTPR